MSGYYSSHWTERTRNELRARQKYFHSSIVERGDDDGLAPLSVALLQSKYLYASICVRYKGYQFLTKVTSCFESVAEWRR